MQTKYIDKEIKYIGSQLAPHWIYKNFKIQGDAIVAFVGECEVKLDNMVDIEDVINAKNLHPNAKLLVHPECKLEVSLLADAVSSTSGIINYVKNYFRSDGLIVSATFPILSISVTLTFTMSPTFKTSSILLTLSSLIFEM